MRSTGAGKVFATFSMAVNGFKENDVTWINVSYFGSGAEKIVDSLTKGAKVGVCGSISLRTFTNKEGVEKSSLDLNAREVTFLSPKNTDGASSASARSRAVDTADIPF